MRRDEVMKLYRRVEKTDPATGKTVREAVYIGPLYTVPGRNLAAAVRRSALYWGLALVGGLGAGFVPALSTHTAWVLLPYLAALVTLCVTATSLWTLHKAALPLTEMQRQEGLERLRSWSVAQAVLAGAWFVSEAVFVLRMLPYIAFTGDGLFLLFAALCAAGSVLLCLSVRGLRAERVTRGELEENAQDGKAGNP